MFIDAELFNSGMPYLSYECGNDMLICQNVKWVRNEEISFNIYAEEERKRKR